MFMSSVSDVSILRVSGFSLAHKNRHFDPFLFLMTPKIIQRGDRYDPQNSKIFLFHK